MIDQGTVAARMELGCDPCNEWEEDGDSGLDLDVDLNSTSFSSQVMANDTLNQ